jgi:iron complex outermembrane recepter protein
MSRSPSLLRPYRPLTRCIRSLIIAVASVCALAGARTAVAQVGTVSGRVADDKGQPVHAASVSLVELRRTAWTDSTGAFRFAAVPLGHYTMVTRRLGFAPVVQEVNVTDAVATLDVALTPSPLHIDAVTITATRSANSALTSPLPVSTLDEDRLQRTPSVSLAHALSGLPGVNALTTGGQIGKPMIRGLSGARVLVLEDGSRLEDYSWSDEDGPSVDARLAQRIEVIRGPASVLYGSDAIGGVVNVIPEDLPESRGTNYASVAGEAYAASNNIELGSAVKAEGVQGKMGWRAFGTGRFGNNIHTPDGELDNTGFFSMNGEAEAGIRGERSSGSLRFAHYGGEFRLLEAGGPPAGGASGGADAGPERKAMDDRLQFDGDYRLAGVRLEAKGQYQRHSLIEVSDDTASLGGGGTGTGQESVAFDLLLSTMTVDLLAHHGAGQRLHGTIGVSGLYQNNDTRGPIPLVPDATVNSGAAFAFEELSLGKWSVVAGGRVDHRKLSVDSNATLGSPDDSRTYTAYSGDAGLVFRPVPTVAFATNVGRAWRAPTLFELYTDGPRLGEERFEIGRADLKPEQGLDIDGSVRWQGERARAELSAFRNRIDDYVFIQPTNTFRPVGATDSLRVYNYQQTNAELTGGEALLEFRATDQLTLRARSDVVRGTDVTADAPLPLIPPLRMAAGFDLQPRTFLGGVSRALRFGVEVEHVARPDRLAASDIPTDGYTLVNLDAGANYEVLGRRFRFDLSVLNAGDTSYRNFLSRYKEFALDPGRNIILRVSTVR